MVGEEVKDDSLYQLSSPETDHYKRALMDLELLIGEDQALLPAIRQLQTQLEVPGASIDCGNHDYFTGLQTSLDGIPFVGGCNQRWKRWKKMAPHAKHVWHDILQRKWQDPKLKPVHEFDYDHAHPCSPQEAAKMQEAEQEMWDLGVLEFEPLPKAPGCCLRHFPVPKDDGTYRIVVDAKQASLNEATPRFKGRGPADLLKFLRKDYNHARTDAKKFFWQVESRVGQRSYQRLHSVVYPGRIARFKSMPMGYKGPPRVAHLMMKLLEESLAERFGCRVYTYVDEILNSNATTAGTYLDTFITRTVLTWLGIHTNFKKSDSTVPTRTTEFCGVRVDSRTHAAAPSEERLQTIRTLAEEMLEREPTGHQLSRLLGCVRTLGHIHQQQSFTSIASAKALGKYIRQHGGSRRLLKANRISAKEWTLIRPELEYWRARHHQDEWAFWPPTQQPVARVTCDASNYGWAGEELSLQPPFLVQDWFTSEERQLSHCAMEYIAATRAVRALVSTGQVPLGCPHKGLTLVQIRTDNQTTVTALNKGRSRNAEICNTACHFTRWLHANGIQVEAVHIVKSIMDNDHIVDQVGRQRSDTWDRCLPKQVFTAILQQLGIPAGVPVIDLAATASSKQTPAYVSRRPDGAARWCNMLSESWNPEENDKIKAGEQLYVFPPANQIDRVLRHIERSKSASVVVVFPVWSEPFLHKICWMVQSEILLFEGGPQLLVPPEGEFIADKASTATWTWAAARIGCSSSTSSARQQVGVKPLLITPSTDDGRKARKAANTIQGGNDGSSFCTAEKRIQACCTGRPQLSPTSL